MVLNGPIVEIMALVKKKLDLSEGWIGRQGTTELPAAMEVLAATMQRDFIMTHSALWLRKAVPPAAGMYLPPGLINQVTTMMTINNNYSWHLLRTYSVPSSVPRDPHLLTP